MSIQIVHPEQGNLLKVTITGKLQGEDYDAFAPAVERLIEREEKIRVLVILRDFDGWSAGALWEDIKFDAKHFNDIERVAIVGDEKWEKGMAAFCKPFTTANVKYFDITDTAAAESWVRED